MKLFLAFLRLKGCRREPLILTNLLFQSCYKYNSTKQQGTRKLGFYHANGCRKVKLEEKNNLHWKGRIFGNLFEGFLKDEGRKIV